MGNVKVTAVIRPSFSRLGSTYSPYATVIRCVRTDQSSQTVTLHYLHDGNCNIRFQIRRQEVLIPVIIIMKVRHQQKQNILVTERNYFSHMIGTVGNY